MPHGERELVVENTLAQIENLFVRVLRKIEKRQHLDAQDHAHLCIFTAAMFSRSTVQGEDWAKQFGKLHRMVEAVEKQHGAKPTTSLQTKAFANHASQAIIGMTLATLPPLLFGMRMAILGTDDPGGFITSDTPCVWFDPEAYKRPPFYRSPGLAYPTIEITLPLSPRHLLIFSHRIEGYRRVPTKVVDEMNRRTRFHCRDYFVSWRGTVKPYWFDPGREPEDAWEKSEEGKRALAERDKWLEAKASWEAARGNEPNEPGPQE